MEPLLFNVQERQIVACLNIGIHEFTIAVLSYFVNLNDEKGEDKEGWKKYVAVSTF